MKISIKRYNNDVSKAYRVMMRKLNAEGFYTELKNKSFHVTKSQKEREERKMGIKRYKKAEAKRQALLLKLENKNSFSKKNTKQNTKEQ